MKEWEWYKVQEILKKNNSTYALLINKRTVRLFNLYNWPKLLKDHLLELKQIRNIYPAFWRGYNQILLSSHNYSSKHVLRLISVNNCLWNALPQHLKDSTLCQAFKKCLKTHLFRLAHWGVVDYDSNYDNVQRFWTFYEWKWRYINSNYYIIIIINCQELLTYTVIRQEAKKDVRSISLPNNST